MFQLSEVKTLKKRSNIVKHGGTIVSPLPPEFSMIIFEASVMKIIRFLDIRYLALSGAHWYLLGMWNPAIKFFRISVYPENFLSGTAFLLISCCVCGRNHWAAAGSSQVAFQRNKLFSVDTFLYASFKSCSCERYLLNKIVP